MVEDVSVAPDRESIVYSANTGTTPGDDDRRHLFRVDAASGNITQLTSGASSETDPVALADGAIAFNRATAQQPLLVTLLSRAERNASSRLPTDFPSSQLVTPREVSFKAADGQKVFGQLFLPQYAGQASCGDLRARRTGPPDAAELALHGLLLERVRSKPNVGEPRIRRALGKLSLRHRLRTRLQLSRRSGGRRALRSTRTSSPARDSCSAIRTSIRITSGFGAARTAAISRHSRLRGTPISLKPASISTACTTGRSISTIRSGASRSSNATSSTIRRR